MVLPCQSQCAGYKRDGVSTFAKEATYADGCQVTKGIVGDGEANGYKVLSVGNEGGSLRSDRGWMIIHTMGGIAPCPLSGICLPAIRAVPYSV